MEVIIQPEKNAAARLSARRIASLIRQKPDAVLGLATGGTPLCLYDELVRLHREEGLDFGRVTTFNLDEYLRLMPSDRRSYHHFMWEHLFSKINISPSRTFVPSGLVEGEAIREYACLYEKEIERAGGIDLQVLGIGGDGHIGFNEPGSSLASRTRLKTLTEQTRRNNAFAFGSEAEVPHHVITMGIGTIMEAREIHLLAFGEMKAQAIADSLEGPVTSFVPASVLQFHPCMKAFLDHGAAGLLRRPEYYQFVFEGKPEWQKE